MINGDGIAELTHCSLSEFPEGSFSECVQLLLRRNRLAALPNDLSIPKCSLVDLYDNLFEEIPQCLSKARALLSLDISFNRIVQIIPEELPLTLEKLYAACNRIRTIDCFAIHSILKLMEFGGNNLREIPLNWQCPALEELWLASNSLEFTFLSLVGCPKLRILALQCNKLTGAISFELPQSIEELWLAQNSISFLQITTTDNAPLPFLNTLDISMNSFVELPLWLVSLTPKLTDLDFKGNLVHDLAHILQILGQMPSLKTLWMRNNPATSNATSISRVYHSMTTWKSQNVHLQDLGTGTITANKVLSSTT